MPKLFLSGFLDPKAYRQKIYNLTTCRLLTMHPSFHNQAQQWFRTFTTSRDCRTVELMLDSGAFSSWSRGEPDIQVSVLLDKYKRALRVCSPIFKAVWFISLDKIPGAPGRTATPDEIRDAVKISDANHHVLASELGNLVLPVFHQSEDLARLDEVCALNSEYICVSPRNDLHEAARRTWSQRVHARLHGVKTHGLAATGGEMMLNVPWTSVDSASWVQIAGFGNVLLPDGQSIKNIAVSEQNSDRRRWGKHGDTAGEEASAELNRICDIIELTREELRTAPGARAVFNIYVMNELAVQPFRPVPVQTTLLEL